MPHPHERSDAAVEAALDALDRAFASEKPFPVQGCLHCYRERDLAELSGPPRLISDDLLRSVAVKTPGHWPDFPRLYRRLTPRIVRALVTGRFGLEPELVAARLRAAEWSTWDEPLADALRDVWAAWWHATLRTHPGPTFIRYVLGFLAVATGGLRPWLDAWTATRTPAADAHLADLVQDVLCAYEITDLRLGFHDEYDATPELLSWLLTDVRERVDDPRLDDPYLLAHLPAASGRGGPDGHAAGR